MKILFTGRRGKSGSFQIRGEQLGRAVGADVIPDATDQHIKDADVVVVVKRTPANINLAKASVLDMVDGWPQPAGNAWSESQAIDWGRRLSAQHDAAIGATARMATDLALPFFLRHHYRPDIDENQIRAKVRTIGYEGSMKYLDNFLPVILRECERREWDFVINPASLADCDIVLAVRGGKHRGYTTDHWKSCVKMSNAIGSLTPMIALPECGYMETGAPCEWVQKPDDIAFAFDAMTLERRMEIAEAYKRLKPSFSLDVVASELSAWIHSRF